MILIFFGSMKKKVLKFLVTFVHAKITCEVLTQIYSEIKRLKKCLVKFLNITRQLGRDAMWS